MTKVQCQRRAEALVKRRQKLSAGILQHRYDVGKLMLELIEYRNASRGRHDLDTVSELTESMGEHSGRIFESIKMVRRLTEGDLAFFKQRAWPYQIVRELARSSRKIIDLINRKYAMELPRDNWEVVDEIKKLRGDYKRICIRGSSPKKAKKKKK